MNCVVSVGYSIIQKEKKNGSMNETTHEKLKKKI